MVKRRRAKKVDPQNELVLWLLIALGFSMVASRLNLDGVNTTSVSLLILLIVFVCSGALYAVFTYKQRAQLKRLRALEISHINDMTGVEFEAYVAALLRFRGYRTKMTPASGDYGVDIIATKNGMRTAVQVKRYNNKIDQKAVREAVTGKNVRRYGCAKAMVVTNSTFTKAAKFLADESDCKLVDKEILGGWILAFQRGSKNETDYSQSAN
jgi:restriction system protein